MPPLFSIVIPTYNSAAHIASCLDSIVAQQFKDFEVLVMDGVSKDETATIVATYCVSYPNIKFIGEKDNGVYDAMNKGIDTATGTWLYFIGADDKLYDDMVLADVDQEIQKNSDSQFIYGNVLYLNGSGLYDGEFDLMKLLKHRNICHQAIFYKRTIFSQTGKYNLKYPVVADYEFNIRCFRHPEFKIKYIERTIAFYNNVHGMSSQASVYNDPLFAELPLTREEEIKKLKNSVDYRIGQVLLLPFRTLKKLITKLKTLY